jgi:hypothetical protein
MIAVCGLEYHEDKGDVLAARMEATRVGIKNAPALMFATPPITDAEYTTQETALTTTYSAFNRGGEAQRSAYEIQLTAANLMMDNTAEYVDGIAKGNVNIIVQAAFKAVNNGRTAAIKPTQAYRVNWWFVFIPNFVVTKTKVYEQTQGCLLCQSFNYNKARLH